jgi:hypothetical protein
MKDKQEHIDDLPGFIYGQTDGVGWVAYHDPSESRPVETAPEDSDKKEDETEIQQSGKDESKQRIEETRYIANLIDSEIANQSFDNMLTQIGHAIDEYYPTFSTDEKDAYHVWFERWWKSTNLKQIRNRWYDSTEKAAEDKLENAYEWSVLMPICRVYQFIDSRIQTINRFGINVEAKEVLDSLEIMTKKLTAKFNLEFEEIQNSVWQAFLELCQDGTLQKFNPNQGIKFSTFMWQPIYYRALKRYFNPLFQQNEMEIPFEPEVFEYMRDREKADEIFAGMEMKDKIERFRPLETEIINLQADGLTLETIAEELNARGVTDQRGGFTASKIWHIIKELEKKCIK